MSSPIRILYVSPCHPAGRAFGTQLRSAQVASALAEVGQLDCVVVRLENDGAGVSSGVQRVIQLQPVGNRSLLERLRCGLDPRFMRYYGHTASEPDRKFVVDQLANYDLVWIHNLRTANALNLWRWPRSVMDLDDVPSTYLRSLRDKAPGFSQRLRLDAQLLLARRREQRLLERFDLVTVCSDADRDYLGGDERIRVIPNGFARPDREPARQLANPPRLGFIGTFEYPPNAEGIRWFVKQVWPLVRQQIPEARLRLVGKGSDTLGLPKDSGTDSLGWLENSAAEIATWSAMIVPVLTGAGTRVKIAEAFSRKCPVVSTSLGAFGYGAVDGRELCLADTPESFAAACVKIIRQPELAAQMAARAWGSFQEKWTWESIQPRIREAAEAGLKSRKP